MPSLTGKVAFITGAARGQGRSHAIRLAEEGAHLVLVDACRTLETVPYPMATSQDLVETTSLVKAAGATDVLAAELDVRDLPGLHDLAGRTMDRFGRIDIVIANAGISSPAPTLAMSEAVWQEMIDVNLTGVWKTVAATVPHIQAGGRGGSVVIVSSLAAIAPHENIAHYTAAKAGLIGLMKVMAKELAPEGIRVNTIHPGTVATPMVLNDSTYRLFRPDLDAPTQSDLEVATRTLHAMPVALLEPEDITATVLHLVSDAGRYITGTTQLIDAGGAL
jgi:SDR family mycofactocin-dependent oxidoreductase